MSLSMHINVNGFDWEVLVVDSHDPKLIVDGTSRRGACWCGHQKIALSNELTRTTALMTIGHELTHAFVWSTQSFVPESLNEEDLCNFVALWAAPISELSKRVLDFFWPTGR